MGWKINNWERFEPPKQNDRDQTGALKYWKCPVSQNRRYKLLTMSGPKGWEMLGIWHAIVASWGRQTRESRKGGVLRTALAGNNPASLSELAADALVPQVKLKAAIAKLLEMGWLCVESNCNPEEPEMDSETRLDKTRLDKTRQVCIGFEEFWKAWPKKKAKMEAQKAFCKINPSKDLLATMLNAIERAKKTSDWTKDGGQFIPLPATWLNNERWTDEIFDPEAARKKAQEEQIAKVCGEGYEPH